MSLIQVALLTAQDACECGMCLRGQSFTCDMCGGTAPWCRGSDDCVERYLASPGGGICDECAGKLPPHVWDAA
ncbi:MAG TPA: hypothetical protein VHC69_20240, partial [Polyangiaceae bacterium]|nr:hypothetical protein [Polyangiaceae bacterium]